MSTGGGTSASIWLRLYHDAEAGAARLLCFPHVGGAASFYFQLSRRLGSKTETLAVQYPGRHDRRSDPPARSVSEMADGVVAALSERGDHDAPLVLFGHSLGAAVAFEVARRLERQPRPGWPAALIASSRCAPSRQHSEPVHLRDDAGVLAELRRLGGSDGGLLDDEDLVQLMLPVVRADFAALTAYEQAGPVTQPLSCPIVAMVGDADPIVPVEDALAWEQFTTGGFEHEVFPGGHFYLTQDADRVTESIRRVLRTYA
jgi:pyochelin biosynthetic protein PchC